MSGGDGTSYSPLWNQTPEGCELWRQRALQIGRIIFLFKIIQWIVNERALSVAQPGQWGCKVIWSINYVTLWAHSDNPLYQKPQYLELGKSSKHAWMCVQCVIHRRRDINLYRQSRCGDSPSFLKQNASSLHADHRIQGMKTWMWLGLVCGD